jgi:hypothetical protein
VKTITVYEYDADRPHTLDVDTVDDIRHAQYVLACLGHTSADVDDTDDNAPPLVLRRDGPPVLVPAERHYRAANVIVTITVDGGTRQLSGLRLSGCGVDVDDHEKFAAAMGRHVHRELLCMLQDADDSDELPF